MSRAMKKVNIFFVLILLTGCAPATKPTEHPSPTSSPEEQSTSTIQTPLSQIATNTPGENRNVCQDIYQEPILPKDLNGKLIFGKKTLFDDDRFNEIYAIHFPDLEEVAFLVADGSASYSYPEVSPDGKYLAVLSASNLLITDAIEIYSISNELIATVPWDNANWAIFYGWAGNENLVIGQYDKSILLVINPFSGTKNIVTLGIADEVRIRSFDPFTQIFALGFENPIDPREIDRTVLLQTSGDNIIHTFDNQVEKPSEIKWSHRGEFIATTNRNEIFLLDNQGNTIERFDFPHNNILIWGIEWSSNDEKIFFWGWDRDLSDSRDITQTYNNTGDFLYEIDIANKQAKSYCLTSKIFESGYSDIRNKNYWVSISPNYFITENYTEYNSSSNIYRYDVLLVDSQSKKAYKLGEQFDLIGWMPYTP